MKSTHISKMERLRSINLRIGLAAAILISIFAFNWTTERVSLPPVLEEAYPAEVTIKPYTINEVRQKSVPNSTVLKPNDLIVEVPNLVEGLLPTTISTDSSSALTSEVGYGNQQVTTTTTKAILPQPEEPIEKEIFIIVEEMPVFHGCELESLSKKEKQECTNNKLLSYLYSKIRYPEMARQNGIEGTVYIKFVIETDGSISNAKILRDIGGGCGEEALRVVKTLPKWTPGKQRGNPVRVQFNLPVKYKLD